MAAGIWPRTAMREHMILLFVLTLGLPASQAQHATFAPRMTGEQLLKRLDTVNPADVTWSPNSVLPSRQLVAEHHTMMNREFVEGYISAVHDASEGKAWCMSKLYKGPKPDTVWDEARWGLRSLSSAQLKRNASDLLIEMWRKKWPCSAEQRRQE